MLFLNRDCQFYYLEMEQNELGPTDLREDLFDHFCEKLDSFCRQYSEEEKHLLAATPTTPDEDVPDFVKKVQKSISSYSIKPNPINRVNLIVWNYFVTGNYLSLLTARNLLKRVNCDM